MIINNQKEQTNLKTSVTYKGNGTQKQFDFPFDYLRKAFVKVSVNDAIVDGYIIDNRSVIFNNAPASNDVIVIYRETTTDRLVSWADASVLKAADMTISQVQQLHIIEEQQDWTITNSMVLNASSEWEGRNHRIANILDPTAPQDVVTKNYMETVQGGFVQENTELKNEATKQAQIATTKANEADVSAKAAKVSETNAKASELAAKASQDAAKVSEDKAKTSETNALTHETNAKASADKAKVSETNAGASASTATTKASQASVSATNAQKAASQADASAVQAGHAMSTAATKAEEASVSAANAKTSETNAKTSETNAKTSETNAKTSETNAGKSATDATTKAGEASASATNAKASETAAKVSETNAKSSEGKAKTSETNAGVSATTATQQATKATTEANRAKTEADRAKTAADSVGNPVVSITQNDGNLTVTKGDGSSDTLTVTPAKASQAEAEAGTDDTKMMTPLKVLQSIKKYIATFLMTAVFTGIIKGVTPPNDANDKTIPTTEWVQALLASKVMSLVVQDYLLEQNGYIRFRFGLILQWGACVLPDTDYLEITFPIAFSNNCWFACGSPYYESLYRGGTQTVDTQCYTKESFIAHAYNISNFPIKWIALGD